MKIHFLRRLVCFISVCGDGAAAGGGGNSSSSSSNNKNMAIVLGYIVALVLFTKAVFANKLHKWLKLLTLHPSINILILSCRKLQYLTHGLAVQKVFSRMVNKKWLVSDL
jgi:hypothetical protein